MRDTGIEPVTSSVSGKRSPAELNAPRADDETRTRDPHLGKVMRYQLRYIRMLFGSLASVVREQTLSGGFKFFKSPGYGRSLDV